MALIILHHVILIVVFCSMTSHATEFSFTYKVQVNSTGGKVCAVDKPSTVIPMAVRAMRMQCGGKCNEAPYCKLFQLNEDLRQCELFNNLPSNFAPIDHCTAYMSSKAVTTTQAAEITTAGVPGTPTLVTTLNDFNSGVLALALHKDTLYVTFDYTSPSKVFVYNATSFVQMSPIQSSAFTSAQLPGLAVDAIHNYLYVADLMQYLVHRFDLSVTSSTSVITWSAGQATIQGLSLTSSGNVLVAMKSTGGGINEYTPSGSGVKYFSENNIVGFAVEVSPGVLVYTVISPLHGVRVAVSGTVTKDLTSYGGSVLPKMSAPTGLAIDASGYILVADSGNNRILVVNPSLTDVRVLPVPTSLAMNSPKQLFLDKSRGRLFIGEGTPSSRVLVLDGVTNIGALFN